MAAMNSWLVELVGFAAAILTTMCWVPQALKTIRDCETRAISLPATLLFALGLVCWLTYGIALLNWPLIAANAVTLSLIVVIIALKLKYG
jgi:MtN3 and saliva related transmembrane protein